MAFHDLKLVFNMISLLHHFSCKYGIFADEIHFSLSIFKYLLDCEVSRQGVTSNISWTRGPKCARALCPGVPTHNLFFFNKYWLLFGRKGVCVVEVCPSKWLWCVYNCVHVCLVARELCLLQGSMGSTSVSWGVLHLEKSLWKA